MRRKAKLLVHYAFLPKKLFSLPDEKAKVLQRLGNQLPVEGPPVLNELQLIQKDYPNSLYAAYIAELV